MGLNDRREHSHSTLRCQRSLQRNISLTDLIDFESFNIDQVIGRTRQVS